MSQEQVFEVMGQPKQERLPRVKELGELGFTWADLEGEPYWIDQVVRMKSSTYAELIEAANNLWMILDKTTRYVYRNHHLYSLLGIPEVLWEMLDEYPLPPEGFISRYARFDFAVSSTGQIKLLELNADTPTGYVEASIATPWVCEQAGISSPNIHMQDLVAAAWAEDRPDTAACMGYGEHLEDSGTIEALVRHSGRTMNLVDCLDLWVDEGILKDASNRAIQRMFALYPKEWMAVDEGGDALAYSIEKGHLQLFNAPHSILLQSKGLLAASWALYELGLLFDENEREVIQKYLLPTYNKPVFSGNYVSKSMFGREGGSVRIYDPTGELEIEDQEGYDTSELFPCVYQKRAELAQVDTVYGPFHLLTGLFVLNGVPCGLLGRAGGLITGNSSHFIAIGVE